MILEVLKVRILNMELISNNMCIVHKETLDKLKVSKEELFIIMPDKLQGDLWYNNHLAEFNLILI